jgi:hypothetical protein
MKDHLYLLKPDFKDGGRGPFFCPESALVEGMLSFYPALREKIAVHYIRFEKPREELASLLGIEHQGAPVLIVADSGAPISAEFKMKTANGQKFIDQDVDICRYLAGTYGYGTPH